MNRPASATSPAAATAPSAAGRPRWRVPLVAGLCFGLGYGVVQRLMDLELPQLVQLGQPFDVREFPGTSLESLRLRIGAPVQTIRGDLGLLELEEQQRQADQQRRADEKRQEEAAAEPEQALPADAAANPAPAGAPEAPSLPAPLAPPAPLPAPAPLEPATP
jgi:hypothetical protein